MSENNFSIKMWAEDDRPREKMQLKGKNALSDAELLAIVLGSGSKRKTAVELAQEILQSNSNSLDRLGKMNLKELLNFSGVGPAKAIGIMATLELGRRRSRSEAEISPIIKSSNDAYLHVKTDFQDLQHEEFRILGLSRNNRVIDKVLISKGGIAGTVVDGKIIFKTLLDMKASACILYHNHPSGNLTPSRQDIKLTEQLIEFGKLIDIQIHDHLIISDSGYYSFSDDGAM